MDVDSGNIHANLPNTGSSNIRIEIRITRDPIGSFLNLFSMSLVYQHRRKDTGEIFYIGIGESIKRAYDKTNRNEIWKRIAQETEYDIEIIENNISREEAKNIERKLISEYGRIDKSTGILSNKSIGGEGDNIGGSGPKSRALGWEDRQKILNDIDKMIPKEYRHLSPSQFLCMILRKSLSSS